MAIIDELLKGKIMKRRKEKCIVSILFISA